MEPKAKGIPRRAFLKRSVLVGTTIALGACAPDMATPKTNQPTPTATTRVELTRNIGGSSYNPGDDSTPTSTKELTITPTAKLEVEGTFTPEPEKREEKEITDALQTRAQVALEAYQAKYNPFVSKGFTFDNPVNLQVRFKNETSGKVAYEAAQVMKVYNFEKHAYEPKAVVVGKVEKLAGQWVIKTVAEGQPINARLDGEGVKFNERGEIELTDMFNPDYQAFVSRHTGELVFDHTVEVIGKVGKVRFEYRSGRIVGGLAKLTDDPEMVEELWEKWWKNAFATTRIKDRLINQRYNPNVVKVEEDGRQFSRIYPSWGVFRQSLENGKIIAVDMCVTGLLPKNVKKLDKKLAGPGENVISISRDSTTRLLINKQPITSTVIGIDEIPETTSTTYKRLYYAYGGENEGIGPFRGYREMGGFYVRDGRLRVVLENVGNQVSSAFIDKAVFPILMQKNPFTSVKPNPRYENKDEQTLILYGLHTLAMGLIKAVRIIEGPSQPLNFYPLIICVSGDKKMYAAQFGGIVFNESEMEFLEKNIPYFRLRKSVSDSAY